MVLPGYPPLTRAAQGCPRTTGQKLPGPQATAVGWVMGRALADRRESLPRSAGACVSVRPSPPPTVPGLDHLPTRVRGFHLLTRILAALPITKVTRAP